MSRNDSTPSVPAVSVRVSIPGRVKDTDAESMPSDIAGLDAEQDTPSSAIRLFWQCSPDGVLNAQPEVLGRAPST